MTQDLKQKTVSGFFWSFVDNVSNYGIQFIIGIILARLLTPKDYGLIGIITIFIVVSEALIESGLTQALIRKNNPTQADYSTVFYFNLIVGIVLYILIFIASGFIADFFKQTLLIDLVKVQAINVIITSLSMVQRTILIKNINFKLQTKITTSSNALSGIIGIIFAYLGFGVWSIVFRSLLNNFFQSILLWIFNKWRPSKKFSKAAFEEMFGFGFKLLIAALINRIYNNIFYFIIGKYFPTRELGLYSRADQFKNIFSQGLNSTIQRVSYPILSSIRDDEIKLRTKYRKLLRTSVFISFTLMLFLAAISKELIFVLLGEKWIESIPYLQLLCFVGMFFPLNALNLNILIVKGRSNLLLKLEIIKKMITIPVILICAAFGIKEMIFGMIIISFLNYFLDSHYSGVLIGYSTFDQIKDISHTIYITFFVPLILFSLSHFIQLSPYILLPLLCLIGFSITVLIGELLKIYEYVELKAIFLEKFDFIKQWKFR